MTDEKQEKSTAEYKNFKYLGKKKVGDGVYSKGKNEGKAWKRYILNFQNGDFEKNIAAFSPMGGKSMQIEELEEDVVYSVGWNPGVKGEKAATAFYLGEKTAEKEKKEVSDTPQGTPESLKGLNLEAFDEFKVTYLETVKKHQIKPNVVHMVGSYMTSKEKDRLSRLIEKCTEVVNDLDK